MTTGEHDVASGCTLWSLAAQWAERRPDELALVSLPRPGTPDGMETLTWHELAEHVWQLRRRLAAAGVREGQRVVICLPNSPLVVAVWLAVQSNGAIVHVVDPDAGHLAIERAIAITDPVLAIAGPGSAALVRDAIAVAGSGVRLAVPADVGVAGVWSGLDLPAASADPPEAAEAPAVAANATLGELFGCTPTNSPSVDRAASARCACRVRTMTGAAAARCACRGRTMTGPRPHDARAAAAR